jgi:hypothetical protein
MHVGGNVGGSGMHVGGKPTGDRGKQMGHRPMWSRDGRETERMCCLS